MLDEVQQRVVRHHKGSLIVHAGPGSGKTRTVAERTLALLAMGAPGYKILIVTFTEEAAKEVKERVEKAAPNMGIWVSTIHALGYAILREALGTQCPRLIDEKQAKTLFLEACHENGLSAGEEDFLYVSNLKARLRAAKHRAPMAYRLYTEALSRANQMDFQDLVLLPVMLFSADRALRQAWAKRWDFVTVDEAHDCTPAEAQMAKTLAGENICLVLDEDQSIYGWREGDPASLASIPIQTRYQLPYTYRCPSYIYERAWRLVRDHTRQQKLACLRDGGEFEAVGSTEVETLVRGQKGAMVLCRTQKDVQEVTHQLKDVGVPVNRVPTVFDSYEADVLLGYAAAATGRGWGWPKVLKNPLRTGVTSQMMAMARHAVAREGFERFIAEWRHGHAKIDQTAELRCRELLDHFDKHIGDFYAVLRARRVPTTNVRVMTMHASKGLEADHVVLYNVSRDHMPFHREADRDAERRLLYVAMTRAKESLRIHYKPAEGPSPFLKEVL